MTMIQITKLYYSHLLTGRQRKLFMFDPVLMPMVVVLTTAAGLPTIPVLSPPASKG
jgi:hypothetical protein